MKSYQLRVNVGRASLYLEDVEYDKCTSKIKSAMINLSFGGYIVRERLQSEDVLRDLQNMRQAFQVLIGVVE